MGSLLASPAKQADDAVRLWDDSDWWSTSRGLVSKEDIATQKREFSRSTFQIVGIDLGDTMFSHAAAKFGKAAIVERGDASSGRSQACYVSRGDREKVHLIFEQGEVEFTFYLFADGPDWEESDLCVASKSISRFVTTAAGLHLGQIPAQVIAILGRPTLRRQDELIYSFSIRKKMGAKDLKEARLQHPELSEKDFQENYGHYNLGAGIHARFAHSKLTYLAVSRAETN